MAVHRKVAELMKIEVLVRTVSYLSIITLPNFPASPISTGYWRDSGDSMKKVRDVTHGNPLLAGSVF